MYVVVKVSPWKMFKNVFTSILAAVVMGVVAMMIKDLSPSFYWQIASIMICVIIYFIIIILDPKNRKILLSLKLRK